MFAIQYRLEIWKNEFVQLQKCPNTTDLQTGRYVSKLPFKFRKVLGQTRISNNELGATSLPLKTCLITGVNIGGQKST